MKDLDDVTKAKMWQEILADKGSSEQLPDEKTRKQIQDELGLSKDYVEKLCKRLVKEGKLAERRIIYGGRRILVYRPI